MTFPPSKNFLDLFTNKFNDLFIRDETSRPFLIVCTHAYAHCIFIWEMHVLQKSDDYYWDF